MRPVSAAVCDCNFDNAGNLWVSEIATGVDATGPTGGALVKVPWGAPTDAPARTTYGEGTLKFPGGVAADSQGNIYIANQSTSSSGSVLRLHP